MMDSKTYWSRREAAQLRKNTKDELEYNKKIQDIYNYMLDNIQKEINGFYTRYAKAEGITFSEAKKRVSKLDIEAYGRKAERYVKNKTFTKEANEEMRLYNATMKINRLEMLKANIGLELVDGFDELQKFFDTTLTNRTIEEFKRQAGILGQSVLNNEKAADSIVNASYQNARYSDRIWMYQDMLKAELSSLLKTGLIQGRNPRELAKHLQKRFGVSRNNAERLMQTELARVQTEAQKQSYERNGYDQYIFIAEPTACPICQALDDKVFDVKKMMPGENASPIHPHCRCSTAAYMDREEFDKWLDHIDKGGTTEEWDNLKKSGKPVEKETGSAIMKLPRYKEAVIPEAKLLQYALNPDKDPNKAKAFKRALGYTLDNAEELIQQIYKNLSLYEAIEKGDRGWGMTYEIIMDIQGPNGKTAKVLTAWIDDKDKKETRLTTVHVD
jgi:SPP1 gp7 family putative phage head morphogenesis protein